MYDAWCGKIESLLAKPLSSDQEKLTALASWLGSYLKTYSKSDRELLAIAMFFPVYESIEACKSSIELHRYITKESGAIKVLYQTVAPYLAEEDKNGILSFLQLILDYDKCTATPTETNS